MYKKIINIDRNVSRVINFPFPYSLRRGIFKLLRQEDFKYYQWLMENVQEGCEHSLEGYIKHRCIFVHIPKCAGISICKTLFGNHGGYHLGIKQYQLAFQKEQFYSYFKFSFVRNPWDRLYSAYKFLASGGRGDIDRKWFVENLSKYTNFREFVLNWVSYENIYKYPHFVPQWKFLSDCHGRIEMDFIGRFETIETDFGIILDKLEIGNNLKHENKNQERNCSYRKEYDKEMIDVVNSVYRKDIELFNYSF